MAFHIILPNVLGLVCGAAVLEYHIMSGLNNRDTSLSLRLGCQIKVWAGLCSLEGVQEDLFLVSLGAGSALACSNLAPVFLCACLSPNFPLL